MLATQLPPLSAFDSQAGLIARLFCGQGLSREPWVVFLAVLVGASCVAALVEEMTS